MSRYIGCSRESSGLDSQKKELRVYDPKRPTPRARATTNASARGIFRVVGLGFMAEPGGLTLPKLVYCP